MSVLEVSEAAFESFLQRRSDSLFSTLAAYEAWHRELGILGVFWASGGERLALLGIEEDGRLLGAARLLRVPFRERKSWGGEGKARGEVQDIALARLDERLSASLIEAAKRRFQAEGLNAFGISSWEREMWPLLERCGLSPYQRSVLLGWDVVRPLPKTPNPNVAVCSATVEQRSLLRRVQQSSWGFFIPPSFHRQRCAHRLAG